MNFVTQLIEGIENDKPKLLYTAATSKDKSESEIYLRDIKALTGLQQLLTDSAKFLLPKNGDVGIKDLTQEIMDLVRAPYSNMVFEFEFEGEHFFVDLQNKEEPILQVHKNIISVLELTTGKGDSGLVITAATKVADHDWVVIPINLFIKYGTSLEELADGNAAVEVKIMTQGVFQIMMENNNFSEDELLDRLLKELMTTFGIALRAIACINAKNVRYVELDAPEKLNKKRAKSNKVPYFSYKILDIFLGEKVIGVRPKDRQKIAQLLSKTAKIHSVRGHFKIRKNGIFWWSSFIRGSKKHGEIKKDYQIKEKEG